jgi:hypothetical protein
MIVLSRIAVCVAQQRVVYQEYIFAGTCFSNRCLAVRRYVTISNVAVIKANKDIIPLLRSVPRRLLLLKFILEKERFKFIRLSQYNVQ